MKIVTPKLSALAMFLMTMLPIVGCLAEVGDDEEDEEFEETASSAEAFSTFKCSASKAKGYKSGKPVDITVVRVDGKPVERNTANAYWVMAKAAERDGVHLRVVSGFRTNAEQERLYSCYKKCNCNKCALAAKPGYSNHQSGLALDLNYLDRGVYAWLEKNARKYGFVRTVPSEKWHWEYRGGGPGGGPCKADAKKSAAKSGCYSETLGKNVPENTCVQSKSDKKWYQCDEGEWVDRFSEPEACSSVHPL